MIYLSITELPDSSTPLKATRLGVGHVELPHDAGNDEATQHIIGKQEEEAVAQSDEGCSLQRFMKCQHQQCNFLLWQQVDCWTHISYFLQVAY